jgi:FkbM family methyltransferase
MTFASLVARLRTLPSPQFPSAHPRPSSQATIHTGPRQSVDLVIAPNEISMNHGTGVLLTRLLENVDAFVTLRAFDHWGGAQAVAPVEDAALPKLDRASDPRGAVGAFVAGVVQRHQVRRIVAVCYFREDVWIALAAKAITGAPMAVYLMDDHVLHHPVIPHAEMAELLTAADARFAISAEMRTAYQNAFRQPFHVLPPVVADRLVRSEPSPPAKTSDQIHHAVMIGNIWHQSWLERLCDALAGANVRLTWYASNEDHHWLRLPPEALSSGLLTVKPNQSTADLIKAVESAAFVVVPSGTFDEVGHQLAIARLSLPSRMPFIVATAGTPILVLGEAESGAGRFIRRFDLGETAPYEPDAIRAAIAKLTPRARQVDIRTRSCRLGPTFRASGVYEMMVSAAENGGVVSDDRFEKAFGIEPGVFGYYVPTPVGRSVVPDQVEMVRAFRRLRAMGFSPDVVLDVGASSGIWSYTLHEVYPDARYILVDPLFSRYPNKNLKDGFEVEECAIAEKAGELTFQVSNDLYNSSLVSVGSVAVATEALTVKVKTVDQVAEERKVKGRVVLKLDVQFAEHLALEGAVRLLADHVDVLMLELTIDRQAPQAKTFREMIEIMAGYGFEYFDEVGEWRHPGTGRLEQKDVLFARAGLFPSG